MKKLITTILSVLLLGLMAEFSVAADLNFGIGPEIHLGIDLSDATKATMDALYLGSESIKQLEKNQNPFAHQMKDYQREKILSELALKLKELSPHDHNELLAWMGINYFKHPDARPHLQKMFDLMQEALFGQIRERQEDGPGYRILVGIGTGWLAMTVVEMITKGPDVLKRVASGVLNIFGGSGGRKDTCTGLMREFLQTKKEAMTPSNLHVGAPPQNEPSMGTESRVTKIEEAAAPEGGWPAPIPRKQSLYARHKWLTSAAAGIVFEESYYVYLESQGHKMYPADMALKVQVLSSYALAVEACEKKFKLLDWAKDPQPKAAADFNGPMPHLSIEELKKMAQKHLKYISDMAKEEQFLVTVNKELKSNRIVVDGNELRKLRSWDNVDPRCRPQGKEIAVSLG
ncbi:MAG: hypothetical protein WCG27_11765, partial [Pseudomonadota bacterium]